MGFLKPIASDGLLNFPTFTKATRTTAMTTRQLLSAATLFLLATPVLAARTSTGVPLPDCDARNPSCVEWRQAVEMMNSAGGTDGGEREPKPRKSPAYLKSVEACVKYHVDVRKMQPAAARTRCEQLMSEGSRP